MNATTHRGSTIAARCDSKEHTLVDPRLMPVAEHRRALFAEAAQHRRVAAARTERRARQLRLRAWWSRPAPARGAAA